MAVHLEVASALKANVTLWLLQTRVEEVIGVLGDRTYPQIRAIDRAYQAQYAKSLIELVTSERQLKGNGQY